MNNCIYPNIISVSRGVAALVMLVFPAFGIHFWILYCWCGFSDMIDGPLARKMNATSEFGSRIDNLSDIVFAVCAGIKILPSFTLSLWIWLWMAMIGLAKITSICIVSMQHHHFTVSHSGLNKLTGLLLFCLPFADIVFEIRIPVVGICSVATLGVMEDMTMLSFHTFRKQL